MNRGKSIVGIHIDDDFLNMVHLGRTEDGLRVNGWTTEPLEEGVIKDGLVIDDEKIARKIRDFIHTNKLKARKAIMSLSCSTIRLKPSEFAAQTTEQLQRQVEDQIGKYAFYGNEEIVFDYCKVEQAARASDKQMVLEAVTSRRISDELLNVAQQAKLDSVVIEPAILPILKLIYDKLQADPDGVSLLLILDSESGSIVIFREGVPQLCQSLSIGVKDVLQEVNDFSCLKEQMKPVLGFARSLAGSPQLLLRIAASCNSDKLDEIAGNISQCLSDLTVEPINFMQIAKGLEIKNAGNGSLPVFAFASAVAGLGICEFAGQLNLVSQESLDRQETRKEISVTAKIIVAIVLLSIAAIFPLKKKIRSVEAASAEIGAKITETMPIRQEISDLERQIKQLEEKQSVYVLACQELTDIPWGRVMRVIGDRAPDAVRIVEISTTESADFTLIGEALTETDVYSFTKKLQKAELIDSAKVEEIEYDNSNTEIVDYKITCKIRLLESGL